MNKTKLILLELKPYKEGSYKTISLAKLMAFCVHYLCNKNIIVTFETLTITAFRLFPDSFSLIGFNEHPDASRTGRALLQARPKYQNLIVGDVQRGYCLTQKGEHVVKQIIEILENPSKAIFIKEKIDKDRTFTGKMVIDKIEKSVLYEKWKGNNSIEPGPYDIWLLLEVAPYTENKVVKAIMRDFREAASVSNRDDISLFLKWLANKYSEIIN